MKIIRGFGVVSMGSFLGVLYAMLGLVVGLVYGGILMSMGALGVGAAKGGQNLGALGGGLAVMALAPFVYGLLGFLFGLLGTVLTNLALKWSGGLEVEMEDVPDSTSSL
ncbi:hypothetical protein ACLESD_44380 [Pyxidicoccus sp. 3LFB2]